MRGARGGCGGRSGCDYQLQTERETDTQTHGERQNSWTLTYSQPLSVTSGREVGGGGRKRKKERDRHRDRDKERERLQLK